MQARVSSAGAHATFYSQTMTREARHKTAREQRALLLAFTLNCPF